jgi:ATP-dependent RNA helicase RhlE
VNFDLPHVPEDYVHRIGRTGRAGLEGQAISLVSADEIKQLQDIERLLKRHLVREEVEGFEPEHTVPASKPIGSSNSNRRTGNKVAQFGNRGGGDNNKKKSRGRSRWFKGKSGQTGNRHAAGDR